MFFYNLIPVVVIVFIFTSCGRNFEEQSNKKIVGDVIYGLDEAGDNRSETTIDSVLKRNDVSSNKAEKWLTLSKSTAGMVNWDNLKKEGNSYFPNKTLKRLDYIYDLCEGERFSDQFSLPTCSGFLVAEDVLVTAGHCVNDENVSRRGWVFDFNNLKNYDDLPSFPSENVYRSKKILFWKKENTGADIAIVKLDRKVINRVPLSFRKNGKISLGTKLVIIGHPHGLTTKITGGAEVTSNISDGYFQANSDTSGGNSGSAVFDAETGVVEGILVRGAKDWAVNEDEGCSSANRLSELTGKESMTRINHVDLDLYINNSEVTGNSEPTTIEPTTIEPTQPYVEPTEPIAEPTEPTVLPFDPKDIDLDAKRKKRGFLGWGEKEFTLKLKGSYIDLDQIEKVTYANDKNYFNINTVSNLENNFKFVFRSRKKKIDVEVIFHLKDERQFVRIYKLRY